MISSSKKRLRIQLLNGSIVELKPLSIVSTEEFRLTLTEINHLVELPEFKSIDIQQGYNQNAEFKFLVDKLLTFAGLSSDQIDYTMLFNLIFPHGLPDGGYERQGILSKFFLGEVKDGSNVPAEYVDYYSKLIGELWASTNSLRETMLALSELDYDTLNAVLTEKAKALEDPKEKAKKASVAKAKKMFDQLKLGDKLIEGDEIEFESLM